MPCQPVGSNRDSAHRTPGAPHRHFALGRPCASGPVKVREVLCKVRAVLCYVRLHATGGHLYTAMWTASCRSPCEGSCRTGSVKLRYVRLDAIRLHPYAAMWANFQQRLLLSTSGLLWGCRLNDAWLPHSVN